MTVHELLSRQLKRIGLNADTPPDDQNKWLKFIEHVNNSYREADEERYLLDRSMQISSQELQSLNDKLENAQHIANLAYWAYDQAKDKILWSKEAHRLMGLNPSELTQSFEQYLQKMHEEDRDRIKTMLKKSLAEGIDAEAEARIQNSEGKYRWYYIKAHRDSNDEKGSHLNGILMDITDRKKAEQELEEIHGQLMEFARQAGMADVANAVLHNIGNILNSANVSVKLLQENIEKEYCNKLFSVIDMLQEHSASLSNYLTKDPKGKLIPDYLFSLREILKTEYRTIKEEVQNLSFHIQHIKDIILTQENISGTAGLSEKVFLPEILDLALKLSGGFELKHIQVQKNYEETPFVTLDKTKLLQILVNLIRNAKFAVIESKVTTKMISLSIKKGTSPNTILIIIQDNGIGIAPENIEKVFSFGFTTKKMGHGYGLHSCALVAKEMGGTLRLESKGIGQGVTCSLTLPIKAEKKGN